MSKKWCTLCTCKGSTGKLDESNWKCPLIKDVICEMCCQIDMSGGCRVTPQLTQAMKITGKTQTEVNAICRACTHGKEFGKFPLTLPDGFNPEEKPELPHKCFGPKCCST